MKLKFSLLVPALSLLYLTFAPFAALAQQSAPPAPPPAQDLPDAPTANVPVTIPPNGPTVVMDTSMGRITCQFFQKQATVYLGRQAIYGAHRDIRGYELLYRRAAGDTTAQFRDADRASAEVMLQAFLEIGLPTVSPLQPVFINHTRHLLAMDPILPPDRCVIEVLEDVAADRETLDALRHLKSLNYRIALDDFVYRSEEHTSEL